MGSATDAGAGTGQETVNSKICRMPSLREKGHIARVCRSIIQEAKPVPAGQGKSCTQQASAHLMQEDTVEEIEDPSTVLYF